jgi:hypothetical protein
MLSRLTTFWNCVIEDKEVNEKEIPLIHYPATALAKHEYQSIEAVLQNESPNISRKDLPPKVFSEIILETTYRDEKYFQQLEEQERRRKWKQLLKRIAFIVAVFLLFLSFVPQVDTSKIT